MIPLFVSYDTYKMYLICISDRVKESLHEIYIMTSMYVIFPCCHTFPRIQSV